MEVWTWGIYDHDHSHTCTKQQKSFRDYINLGMEHPLLKKISLKATVRLGIHQTFLRGKLLFYDFLLFLSVTVNNKCCLSLKIWKTILSPYLCYLRIMPRFSMKSDRSIKNHGDATQLSGAMRAISWLMLGSIPLKMHNMSPNWSSSKVHHHCHLTIIIFTTQRRSRTN